MSKIFLTFDDLHDVNTDANISYLSTLQTPFKFCKRRFITMINTNKNQLRTKNAYHIKNNVCFVSFMWKILIHVKDINLGIRTRKCHSFLANFTLLQKTSHIMLHTLLYFALMRFNAILRFLDNFLQGVRTIFQRNNHNFEMTHKACKILVCGVIARE